ncbi:uncharacterized protein CXQ87_000335 [Candidozyma duobushaemuli]|uniref:Helicase C-terminal domain-containing protein n=1 Tax=Candidozyma duobushaemuli TaxID=1231522 RepID=A0A2V1AHI6_9ASCO|nr:uncharacterized protein CXQ87_000335 [[Candida] duobushaemulonis]PVH17449.1 hypothetical protein CXQ87_000335 [[Candida] duobushaemulonis]
MVSEIQQVCRICGDLDGLLAVGTLLVTGLDGLHYGYEGVATGQSRWKWVDPWFLETCVGNSASTHIRALSSLLRHRFFVATYKRASMPELDGLAKVSHCITPAVYRVRLYCVPNDIEGARFVKSWRNRLASDTRSKRIYRSNWSVLREVVDFTAESWYGQSQHRWAIVPLTGRSTKPVSQHESFHIQRWLESQFCSTPSLESQPLLETVVKRVYDEITPPDLSSYKDDKFVPPNEIPSSDEIIKGLVNCYYRNQFPIRGVASTLYPFQLNSVCKMYEKESLRQREVVPNYRKVVSPRGDTYFVDIFDMDFHKLPDTFLLPRGGILAENMGLGKTLICLSLICLTKHQFSTIPEDAILHDDQGLDGTVNERPIDLSHGMKSLWEICRDSISQNSLPWKFFKDDLPDSVVEKLTYRPGFFKLPLHIAQNQLGLRARHAIVMEDRFRVLYLCSTTLVIVPENLFHQWHSEMVKHLSPNFLKSLFVSDRFQEHMKTESSSYTNNLPSSPQELIQYDLVVMTIPSFQKWSRPEESILRKIHWKRLIIDEGHTMGSRTTSLSSDCKALSCERVWAVTGTPTSGLTNLHMNEEEPVTASPSKKRKYTVKSSFSVKDDLARVGNLVSSFFKIEPYYSQPRLWGSILVRNLTAAKFSTESSLRNLLNVLLVRHGLSDVEKDLKLPQLHHEAVFIDPSYQNKLAINLFTAVLAVNAVSSEREGSDYMFEASNHQQLRKLVNNLQLATFYWTGFKQQDVETLCKIADHCLKKKTEAGDHYHSTFDRELLEKSMEASLEALHNQRWRTAAALHEMLYYVEVENQRSGLKSIVFFEYEDSAYYLSEFLDIIGVKYILYATFIGASQRSNNLTDFDRHDANLDGGIVLIMDLRLAAHGLTVISATRVYFISPVWHRSKEAQAIKRAHRIGQTQEVFVETLVLRGTLEEEIYKRRAQVDSESSSREMIDDKDMQKFILKHDFLSTKTHEMEHAPFSIPAHDEHTRLRFDDEPDEVSLKSHIMSISNRNGITHHNWTMRLFTQDNLDKLNSMKQQKPTKAQSAAETCSPRA